jgi:hypothetical protein
MTVMDADTCFAADYFAACVFHYATASPEQRRIMMFAPTTVFDRYVHIYLHFATQFKYAL